MFFCLLGNILKSCTFFHSCFPFICLHFLLSLFNPPPPPTPTLLPLDPPPQSLTLMCSKFTTIAFSLPSTVEGYDKRGSKILKSRAGIDTRRMIAYLSASTICKE